MKFKDVHKGLKKGCAYALLLGALSCAPNLKSTTPNSVSYNRPDNSIILEDKISESGVWENIHTLKYLGRVTMRDVQRQRIALLAERGEELYKDVINYVLLNADNETKLYFLCTEDISDCSGFFDFVEPTTSEIKEYEQFINKFYNQEKDLNLIKNIYEEFQIKTNGVESNAFDKEGWGFLGDKPVHPAVLFSGRENGVCADKAFALYDIYTRLGFAAELIGGHRVGADRYMNHMWVRVYAGDDFFDMDPTLYNKFVLLKRIENED